jgi:hypothetical protein
MSLGVTFRSFESGSATGQYFWATTCTRSVLSRFGSDDVLERLAMLCAHMECAVVGGDGAVQPGHVVKQVDVCVIFERDAESWSTERIGLDQGGQVGIWGDLESAFATGRC